MENLRAENENLRNQLTEAANVIEELQAQLSSNYVPKNTARTAPVRKNGAEVEEEQIKNDARTKLGIKK